MKRLVLMIIAVCLLHACKERKGYTVRGELADSNGLELVLMRINTDSEPEEINSCVVKKGKFVMKGKVEFPEYCVLYAGDNGPLQFFVENTVINITVDIENMQESTITGSHETDLLMGFFDLMSEFEEKKSTINEEYMTMLFSEEIDEEKQNELIAQINDLEQLQLGNIKLIVEENPNTVFTAILLNSMLTELQHDELERFANGFDETKSRSPWVQMFKESFEKEIRLAIGQPFIDIRMAAPDGTEIAISDYAGKGKYVLIDFWASWCQPCRVVNPEVVKLYNKYKEKGFEIIGISLDRDKDQWLKAIEDDKLTWIQMSDLGYWQSEAVKLYSLKSIPHTILLDRDGNIIAKGLHVSELEEKLAELTGK